MVDGNPSHKSGVEFIEEWQTGFFLLIGSAIAGFLISSVAGSAFGPTGGVAGFFGGAVLAFLCFSVVLYGR